MAVSSRIIIAGFSVALMFGAVLGKTGFCTMGAISDWVNMDDTGRLRAWGLASAIALVGATTLEAFGVVALDVTRPLYRSSVFSWTDYLLGGLMFGVGMTLAGGCISRNLVRLGNGNLKAFCVVTVAAGSAYLITESGLVTTFGAHGLLPLSVDLERFGLTGQDLGCLTTWLFGFSNAETVRCSVAVLIAGSVMFLVLRSSDFRASREQVFCGLSIGGIIVSGWYITGGPWGKQWMQAARGLNHHAVGIGTQSFTFVTPLSEVLSHQVQAGCSTLLTFGVASVVGISIGAFIQAVISRRFRIDWFSSRDDICRHLAGAALMGSGGSLAMGCTIGQGITGVSTLALGSFLTLGAIVLGSATTLKIQYYKMLYGNANFWDVLLTSWVDLHLLPRSMRRLDTH